MIRILTDSTADLSPEDVRSLGLRVVPLLVNFGEEHYRDGIDLAPEEFYDKLAQADKLPTTSQPSPELFQREFEEARDAGDDVVCVLLSCNLSGTYQSAQIAQEEVGYGRVFLVDSGSATLGEQVLVRRAAQPWANRCWCAGPCSACTRDLPPGRLPPIWRRRADGCMSLRWWTR